MEAVLYQDAFFSRFYVKLAHQPPKFLAQSLVDVASTTYAINAYTQNTLKPLYQANYHY